MILKLHRWVAIHMFTSLPQTDIPLLITPIILHNIAVFN